MCFFKFFLALTDFSFKVCRFLSGNSAREKFFLNVRLAGLIIFNFRQII